MVLSLSLGLWVLAFAGLAVSVVLGLMLVYHWMRYAMDAGATILFIVLYGAGSAALLSVLFTIATNFQSV